MTGTMLVERKLTDRAQEYDRALRQSQKMATSRRRNVAAGDSTVGMPVPDSVMKSTMGDNSPSTALTAVMDESRSSVLGSTHEIPSADLAPDGGVGSGLGESYVDGTRATRQTYASQQEDEDGLEDGGVLGLLAQIYGTKGPDPGRVL